MRVLKPPRGPQSETESNVTLSHFVFEQKLFIFATVTVECADWFQAGPNIALHSTFVFF